MSHFYCKNPIHALIPLFLFKLFPNEIIAIVRTRFEDFRSHLKEIAINSTF